ncbi:MAG: adenylate/guanylate cyclase domain-containing protein [Acidimicrobiia bacterium]|nr:adenylate/guanylate cyclase domain-containing protein [Acidimicrobiia bacterium]NNL27472.1 adenylate/guanylate cyclase domain-containing protein [Acidimicrobiia bacterium]
MNLVRRLWRRLMEIGAYEGEPNEQAGKRRIVIGYMFFGQLRWLFSLDSFSQGTTVVGWTDVAAASISLLSLFVLRVRPSWFTAIMNLLLFTQIAEVLVQTVALGGIIRAEGLMLFGMLSVIGALIVFSARGAFLWFLGYLVSLVLAVVLPEYIEPLYQVEGSAAGIAFVAASVAAFLFFGMAYFVRQRDRFQQESDDLLHNILPDEIATRLKTDTSMIADDFPQASVLFADVVGFTPMSTTMTPPELVGLLNDVFSKFDEFVEELGLEKIKTIGDEYMVAAGVPVPRDDHAEAIAELALRIRDHMAETTFNGHRLEMRIGIHSGPVVAGIIGTHKFAYDLWGDTVNTASRMESGGIPGAIQATPTTHELLSGNGYAFEPRGTIEVKGKGHMNTWLLVGRN